MGFFFRKYGEMEAEGIGVGGGGGGPIADSLAGHSHLHLASHMLFLPGGPPY